MIEENKMYHTEKIPSSLDLSEVRLKSNISNMKCYLFKDTNWLLYALKSHSAFVP